MSRGAHTPLSLSITLALFAPSALAQTYDGTWRITRDTVNVTINDWGDGCGPRPSSHNGTTGREVTVRTEGSQLSFSAPRSWRTDRCLSDNRDVSVQSASGGSGRWTVVCATAASVALGERGTSTLSATDANHLRLRDETTYAWSIRGSTCRAVSTLERDFERTSAAPPTPPPPPPPPTPPPPPPPRPVVNRCANVGAPSAILLSPSQVRTTPGRSTCLRARVVDSNRCEVSGQTVTWATRRLSGDGDGTVERGCFLPSANATGAEFEVTAASAALSARAVVSVVSTDRYRDLIAAHLEDPDAGTITPPSTSGTSLGGTSVAPPSVASPRAWLPWALLGAALALGVLAFVLLLTRRTKPNRDLNRHVPAPPPPPPADPSALTDPPPPNTPFSRERHDVIPPSAPADPKPGSSSVVIAADATSPIAAARAQSASPNAPTVMMPFMADPNAPAPREPVAAPKAPVAAPVAAPVPQRRCPTCNALVDSALSYCPHDGTHLLAAALETPHAAMICPHCGTRSSDGSRFCSNDGTVLIAAPATAAIAPARAEPDGVCPVCKRRYPSPTTFCGEDGAKLVAIK